MQIDSTRKLYSIKEVYNITLQALRTAPQLRRAKKRGEIDQQFIERIMLAVTEVNGCAICSYAHTRMALEAGLKNDEIEHLLAGGYDGIPSGELQAILFAQHYADSRGAPSKESWDRITEAYGLSRANGILGAIRIIMLGNALGIAWSSFFGRIKGKPDKRSSLPYELGIMACSILFIPAAPVHILFLSLQKAPLIRF